MPELIIWKDRQFDKLRREMDQVFNRVWGDFGLTELTKTVTELSDINLTETRDSLKVKVNIPGINPKDINIDITENYLTINIKSKVEKVTGRKGLVRTRQSYKSFSRTIQLPCRITVDEVRASYKEGVLNINMPKQKQKKGRVLKIEI
jgi:HSP20 family protein